VVLHLDVRAGVKAEVGPLGEGNAAEFKLGQPERHIVRANSIDSPESHSELTSFSAIQHPLYREHLIACSPQVRNSATDAGYRIGMPAEVNA